MALWSRAGVDTRVARGTQWRQFPVPGVAPVSPRESFDSADSRTYIQVPRRLRRGRKTTGIDNRDVAWVIPAGGETRPCAAGESTLTAAKIRVLLVDDHTLLRQGLRAILDREADIRVIGEASDGRDALRKATALKPDVVVLDISMPRVNGVEATRHIRADLPATRVVALSMHDGEDYVESILRAGATGYVLKDAPARDLVAAIRAARAGGLHLDPRISASVVARYLEKRPPAESRPADPESRLTPREREILQLIAAGNTNRDIAKQLSLSVKTVEAHRTRIMSKLDVHNVAGLTRYAIGRGMVRPE